MITQTVFRRNYFVFASIVVIFIFIGVATAWIILTAQRDQMAAGPAQYVTHFFSSLDADPFKALEKVKRTWPNGEASFDLIDKNGVSAISGKSVVDAKDMDLKELATQGYIPLSEGIFGGPPRLVLKTQRENIFLLHKMIPGGKRAFLPPPPMGMPGDEGRGGPPPPPGMMGMGPGGMGPGPGSMGPGGPPPPMDRGDRDPHRGQGPRPPFMGPPPGGGPDFMLITLGSITACVLISLGIALFYQFSKYKHQANEAFTVLNQLREGNLSARMSTAKRNELSALTDAFNLMADDVEHLVDNLKKADAARRTLLQDLAHDLRTPLTSLKTFLDTLKMAEDKISSEKRQEVLTLCLSETEYFANLVEDLLFMAQITEPKYSKGTEKVQVHAQIQDQISIFKQRYPHVDFAYSASEAAKVATITGSSKLIDRALRNAFENSSSFAKSRLQIDLSVVANKLQLVISDDGPGFSEKALREYGLKKASRILSGSAENKRISVGIGSVIIREILALHSGELKAANIQGADQILGGQVSFSIPLI